MNHLALATIGEILKCGNLTEEDLNNAGLQSLSFIHKKLDEAAHKQSLTARECAYSAYSITEDRAEDKAALYSSANGAEAKAESIRLAAADVGSIMNKKNLVTDFLAMESALYDSTNYPPILPFSLEAYELTERLKITDQCMVLKIDNVDDKKTATYTLGRVLSYTDISSKLIKSRITQKFYKIQLKDGGSIIAPINFSAISMSYYDNVMRSSEQYKELYKKILKQTTPGLKEAEIIL